jgi:ABC-2 type transport system permease protein
MTAPSDRASFLGDSLLLAGRQLRRWRSSPLMPIQSVLFPTLLLIVYYGLVGESMTRIAGTDNLSGMVPMCALAGGMFGALGAGFAIPFERTSGMLSRLWTLPVHRLSLLVGKLLAEAVRAFVGALLITAVGVALGLRFRDGWLIIVPYLLVAVLVVVVFALVVITLALAVGPGGNTMFTYLGTASIGLVFGSSGVAPIGMFPSWLRPVIEYQPMSPPIELMRALAEGGSVVRPLVMTLAWMSVLAAIFAPLAVRNYRRAAELGN